MLISQKVIFERVYTPASSQPIIHRVTEPVDVSPSKEPANPVTELVEVNLSK